MREIRLTKGHVAIIDDEDFELVGQYSWHSHSSDGRIYARATIRNASGQKSVYMHRMITRASEGELVDHKDRNTLNNTRGNLRKCSNTQNNANSRLYKCNSSGYKGVSYYKRTGDWEANIRIGGKKKYLGKYPTPIEAALVYDAEARRHFGEFARLNFPSKNENAAHDL